MSNNLRQIAKDLRSFVKRCKDVHYSDSLLITFLVTGLLTTFAPSIIRADVAEDQQEVSAQAYDTITDLRQSFLRAKKENQKALRGANAELAQLLKQGDQVVKSPWASFQFGTGYTNNDWGTAYKGRGGKKLEYYSRTNDLTKYVFDASKHQYGATNLNVKRNKEPNSLTINPANIHQAYEPYAVDKLDALSIRTAPEFNPQTQTGAWGSSNVTPTNTFTAPTAPNALNRQEYATSENSAFRDHNLVIHPSVGRYETNNLTFASNSGKATDAVGLTNNTTLSGTNTAVTKATSGTPVGTLETGAGKLYTNHYYWWGSTDNYYNVGTPTLTTVNGGTFSIGQEHAGYTGSWWWSSWWSPKGWSNYSGVSVNGSGDLSGNDDYAHSASYTTSSGLVEAEGTSGANDVKRYAARYLLEHQPAGERFYSEADALAYVNSHNVVDTTSHNDGTHGARTVYRINPSYTAITIPAISGYVWSSGRYIFSGTYNYGVGNVGLRNVDASIHADSNTNINNTDFNIRSGTSNPRKRSGVIVDGSRVNITGSSGFDIDGSENAGVIVKTGTLSTNNTTFGVGGAWNNAKNVGIWNLDKTTLTGNTFNVTGGQSSGIVNSGANSVLSITGGTYDVTGEKSNAIENEGYVSITDGVFKVRQSKSAIISNLTGGKVDISKSASATDDVSLQVLADKAVGIQNTDDKVTMTDTGLTVTGSESYGVNNGNGAKLEITRGHHYINNSGSTLSNLVMNAGEVKITSESFTTAGKQATFTTNANKTHIIENDSNATKLEIERGTFTVNGEKSTAILASGATLIDIKGSRFIIQKNKSNAIEYTGSDKITINRVQDMTQLPGPVYDRPKFTIADGVFEANGIHINDSAGNTANLDVRYSDFVINNTNSTFANTDRFKNNGIYLEKAKKGAVGDNIVNNTSFNLKGVDTNAILQKEATLSTSDSTFNINGGRRNNGVFIDHADAKFQDTNSAINVAANNEHSNGIYAKQGQGLTLRGTVINVNGTSTNTSRAWHTSNGNNGVMLWSGMTNINIISSGERNTQITSDGDSNGIFVTNGVTVDSIKGADFVVKNDATGILIGDNTGRATVSEMKFTTFNVETTNAASDGRGTGIYVRDGKLIAGEGVHMTGNGTTAQTGKDIFVTVDTDKANELHFLGKQGVTSRTLSSVAFPVFNSVSITGGSAANYQTNRADADRPNLSNENIAFNFQKGSTSDGNTITIDNTDGTNTESGVDITFYGDKNSGFKVNKYINTLKIINGNGATTGTALAAATDTLSSTTTSGNGTIRMIGNDNAAYNGLGFVQNGEIILTDVQMSGDRNTIINLQAPRVTKVDTTNGLEAPVGAFGGTIRVQGALGGDNGMYALLGNKRSTNNVAIYAASGQNTKLSTDNISSGLASAALTAVDVQDINVGFGSNSYRGVLVYSTNGTEVNVQTGTTYDDGASGTVNAITDGVKGSGASVKRGYNKDAVPYEYASEETIMGFANGYLNGVVAGKYAYDSGGNLNLERSTIKFDTDVDMISKKGVAYFATTGGKVTTDKNTRAGGSESIVAFSTGRKPNSDASEVKVKNITAADYLVLAGDVTDQIPNTYKNIGAVALNGGKVTIDSADAEAKAAEQNANGINDATATAASTTSLIYGMGAYADGANSLVEVTGSASGTNKVGIHVVTGENGGLYATNSGEIKFGGFITNQNNIVASSSSKINTTEFNATNIGNGKVATTTVTRKGIYGTTVAHNNDHFSTSPFYVKRTGTTDTAAINFTKDTYVAMYDGILYEGNKYGGPSDNLWLNNKNKPLSDYYKGTTAAVGEETKFAAARYRGMENVTTYISNNKSADGGVNIGLINQADKEIKWDTNQAGGTGGAGFLKGIGTDYTGMKIMNVATTSTEHGKSKDQYEIYTTVINSKLNIDGQSVLIEDSKRTGQDNSTIKSATYGTDDYQDPFNNIAMESDKLTISNNAKILGNAAFRDTGRGYNPNYQINKVGLYMGNSLSRWKDINNDADSSNWEKTPNTDVGIINKGKVDIWGGQKASTDSISALLVQFGTLTNDGSSAVVAVDHGNALAATDGSFINNTGGAKVVASGVYNPTAKGTRTVQQTEAKATGENYGIVGISDTTYTSNGTDNSININHEDSSIYAAGDLAVGIYAQNAGNAAKGNVVVNFKNSTAGSTGIDVRNNNAQNEGDSKGVGIALVNGAGSTNGGTLNLTGGSNGALASYASDATTVKASESDTTAANDPALTLSLGGNDIATGKNGIGIYAEDAEINVRSDKFTIETKDDGVGLWGMDNTTVARGTTGKTFQYNYNGAKDKNGFAMAFGGKRIGATTATNYMDIKFTNQGDATPTIVGLQTPTRTKGTDAGIVGMLVNTNDDNDLVVNKGKIEEDQTKSKTYLRAYGALVNKGIFENHGEIKLAESLMPNQASDVKREDLQKVNIGIRANAYNANTQTGGIHTTIRNYADITIGDNSASSTTKATNIGSWAIYGYNVETGKNTTTNRNSEIVINKNSYGIYSGDGNVTVVDTDIKVGNDSVLGHEQVINAKDINGNLYTIDRQNGQYATANTLLSDSSLGRKLDSAIGVYIDNNFSLTNTARNHIINANMDIDRFSYGIVLAEKNSGRDTNITIGTSTNAPRINLAYSTNNNAGGHVHSEKPSDNPRHPEEIYEQGNAVYYYSADTKSRAKSYADVKMDGDYNTAYYTKGSVENYGTIDLRSQYDLDLRAGNASHEAVGYGSVGIASENTDINYASKNYGTITTGLSDTQNMMYSVAMGAGRNHYRTNTKGEVVYDRTDGQGIVVNEVGGVINVQEKSGIGMLATGRGSMAINKGTINLIGDNAIGMYIDREAVGINDTTGVIKGTANNLKGVIAINGGFIKNYGTIEVTGSGSTGIITDSSKFVATGGVDAYGKPEYKYLTDSKSDEYKAAVAAGTLVTSGEANGHNGNTDVFGGTESSIEEGSSGNPKTTGVTTTITRPDIVPLASVTIDGVDTPIFDLESIDAVNPGDWGRRISITSSIQTGGTRILDLSTRDEYGNPAWPSYRTEQTSEITRVGMYVDTSGVKYTNPINGLGNLTHLGKVDLYFGPEVTMYTNSKAIRIGDTVDANGTVVKSNILKPFNDALRLLSGGAIVNPLSSSLTWQVSANIDDNNQITELYMSKVPYHSFAFDGDKRLINFTNNLDNLYEIARPGSEEKMIFNKLNSLGNGEGHILAQAFDQMRGHIYGGIQQRTNATSNLLTDELAQLRNENNASKDSNKIKAFGRKEEYKTDTAGQPDWNSNAGGFVYLHEDETVKLGDRSGWYAGVVNNYFTFKDLARSYENQAMLKTGIFKQTPLDEDGTFTFTIGGDAFFGKTNTKRRFWVVDKEFRAKSDYYTYGADINAKLEKEFRLTEGFSIVPNVGLDVQYGRFSTVREDGDMALKIKSDDYYSVKPRAGVDFRYAQPIFKKSNFTASVGLAYETELGRLNDVDNEAKIQGAWTDYYSIKGDKEDRKGNFKSDLKLGLDNGRLGFTVNTGYDTKGHNFRAGLGLKALF